MNENIEVPDDYIYLTSEPETKKKRINSYD